MAPLMKASSTYSPVAAEVSSIMRLCSWRANGLGTNRDQAPNRVNLETYKPPHNRTPVRFRARGGVRLFTTGDWCAFLSKMP